MQARKVRRQMLPSTELQEAIESVASQVWNLPSLHQDNNIGQSAKIQIIELSSNDMSLQIVKAKN